MIRRQRRLHALIWFLLLPVLVLVLLLGRGCGGTSVVRAGPAPESGR